VGLVWAPAELVNHTDAAIASTAALQDQVIRALMSSCLVAILRARFCGDRRATPFERILTVAPESVPLTEYAGSHEESYSS